MVALRGLILTSLDTDKLTRNLTIISVVMLCSKARKQRQKMLRSMNVNEEKDGDDLEDGTTFCESSKTISCCLLS